MKTITITGKKPKVSMIGNNTSSTYLILQDIDDASGCEFVENSFVGLTIRNVKKIPNLQSIIANCNHNNSLCYLEIVGVFICDRTFLEALRPQLQRMIIEPRSCIRALRDITLNDFRSILMEANAEPIMQPGKCGIVGVARLSCKRRRYLNAAMWQYTWLYNDKVLWRKGERITYKGDPEILISSGSSNNFVPIV